MKFSASCLFLAVSVGAAQDQVVPVLNFQIPDFTDSAQATGRQIDLSDYFQMEPILPDMVRLVAQWDDAGVAKATNYDFLLFKERTPLTRDNFLGYVSRGDYLGMFVHRVATDFVIQGGNLRVNGGGVENVPTQPPVPNEFGVSNTEGTLSMAKLGGDPDSATSQWFISLGPNSDNLDFQNGGFTVFGRISKETFPNTNFLNYSSAQSEFLQGPFFGGAPLHRTTSFSQLNTGDLFLFTSVSEIPVPSDQAGTSVAFTFSAVAKDPNPDFTLTTTNGILDVDFLNPSIGDEIEIEVTAEDSVGNIVEDSFVIRLADVEDYENWRAANFTGSDLIDEAISGPAADPNGDGASNLQAFAQGYSASEEIGGAFESVEFLPEENKQRFTFRYRTDIAGVRVIVERSRDLVTWRNAPFEANFETLADGPVSRRVLTVPENEEIQPKTFYRLRFLRN